MEIIYRQLKLQTRKADAESRTVPAVLSTDGAIERGDYREVLDHGDEAVDLSRAGTGLPLLESHDTSRINIGKVDNIRIDGGRMVGEVKFGKSSRASELFEDVVDGVVDGVSVGYIVRKWDVDEENKTYTARNWMPFEVSAVSVPADPNAGFFRSISPDKAFDGDSIVKDDESPDERSLDEQPESAENEREETRNEEPSESQERAMTEETKETREQKPEIDVKAVESAAMENERKRIAEITKLGDKFNQRDMANQAVEGGKSVEEFRDMILSELPGFELRECGPREIGLSEQEKRQFSFLNIVRAIADPGNSKVQEAAAFEREVSDAAAKEYGKAPQGFLVPDDITEHTSKKLRTALARMMTNKLRRDLTAGSSTKGQDVVDTLGLRPESFIDLLRNAIIVESAGATTFSGLQGDVAIPRQTGGSTAYWVAENGTVTESDQTFDQVTMSPKTVGAVTEISRRLLIQSSIDIEAFVRMDLATNIGIEIDRVAIEGSGTNNQPEGILNTSGIGAYSATSGTDAITWDLVVGLWKEVAQDNAAMGSLGWLASAPVIAKLLTTRMDTGSGRFIMENLQSGLLSYPVYRSENVPTDLGSSGALGALIFGNMSDLLIGYWSGVDVLRDPYSNSKTGAVRIVTMVDCDVDVRHPESFAATQDLVVA